MSYLLIKERVEKIEARLLEIKSGAERGGLSIVTQLIDENIPPEESSSTYFKDKNINLIVVAKGKGKRENFKAGMLGSTAPIIARYADCSYTIIK